MITNYFIYLMNLPKEEQVKQILILLAFFTILIVFCLFLKFLKLKFLDETKDSLFQRFLRRL